MSGAVDLPAFDRTAIEAHISLLHDLAEGLDGVLILAAFEAGGRAQVQRFRIGNVDGMVATIMGFENHPNLNLYVPWSVFRRDLEPSKKGSEADVIAVLAAVGDLDNDKYSLGELPVEAPYIVETSPGNFQPVYIFERPLAAADAKPALAALCDFIGGDSGTKDCSHVWRIPGTKNIPTKSKLARGRSPVPAPVTIKKTFDGRFVSPAALLALAPAPRRPNRHDAEPSGSLTYTEEARLRTALAVTPAEDRDTWLKVGAALHLVGARAPWDDWSKTSTKFDAADQDRVWASFHGERNESVITIATIYHMAKERGWTPTVNATEPFDTQPNGKTDGVRLNDFVAYMPMHSYIFMPDGGMWPGTSVNARIPPVPLFNKKGEPVLTEAGNQKKTQASAWLDKHKPVEQMTWAPGEPQLIKGRLMAEGAWIDREGLTVFNLYRPPVAGKGNADGATRWVDLVRAIYPEDVDHLIAWLAHRTQRPQEKINHALVLGGVPGIGKDTLLEPVKRAVGPWNFVETSPQQVTGRFNGFLKSVILRISEAHDTGDVNRYQFYEHLKSYCAAPPDTLRIDEKNMREYSIMNVTSVILTTNHKTDGIFLPPDDRRHYVAWSPLDQSHLSPSEWTRLWDWYEEGGFGDVAAYLRKLDISSFNPKAPPKKTEAFWAIVDAGRAPEDAELADLLDEMGNPDAFTTSKLVYMAANREIGEWLRDRKNRRIIPKRLEACGYEPVRNDCRDTGLWVVNGTRQVIYAISSMTLRDKLKAASKLAGGSEGTKGSENASAENVRHFRPRA